MKGVLSALSITRSTRQDKVEQLSQTQITTPKYAENCLDRFKLGRMSEVTRSPFWQIFAVVNKMKQKEATETCRSKKSKDSGETNVNETNRRLRKRESAAANASLGH